MADSSWLSVTFAPFSSLSSFCSAATRTSSSSSCLSLARFSCSAACSCFLVASRFARSASIRACSSVDFSSDAVRVCSIVSRNAFSSVCSFRRSASSTSSCFLLLDNASCLASN
uniref:Putative secreted protein n=1 Tax=Anopheles marajoara TaxID=58244 RepID=A0A2M4C7Y5_9DIPT